MGWATLAPVRYGGSELRRFQSIQKRSWRRLIFVSSILVRVQSPVNLHLADPVRSDRYVLNTRC